VARGGRTEAYRLPEGGSRKGLEHGLPVQSTAMKVLLVSGDPNFRDSMAVAVRSTERRSGGSFETLEARDGIRAARLAWRERPDVVVSDEIVSGMGAFALARELKGAQRPFVGMVVIVLDRPEDAWLARWSGADAWFVKPVNPFEFADAVAAFLGREREEAV
jgi:DNA-binding response OmpR family regulator